MNAEFDSWAPYYDLIHQGIEGESEFYLDYASRSRGRILELGCGTGRISIPMALAGADLTGVDNSKAMLALCRAKMVVAGLAEERLKLVHKDMARFALPAPFDLIVVPYRSFMHLHHRAQQRSCLTAIRDHLSEDGLCVLNVWKPSATVVATHQTPLIDQEFQFVGEYGFEEDPIRVRHFHRAFYDESRQRILEEHFIEEVEEEECVVESATLMMSRVWATAREMTLLFEVCGLQVVETYGDFSRNPITALNHETIWVLRKA